MKIKLLFFITIIVIILMQFNMLRLLLQYPFYGIKIDEVNSGEWRVSGFDSAMEYNSLNLHVGDLVKKINNNNVDQHKTINWGVAEQFESILIARNGNLIFLSSDGIPRFSKVDIQSIVGETISFLIALFVYLYISKTKSATLLCYLFITIGITFLNISSSDRADTLSKIILGTSLILIPSVFLHFLLLFFKEKGTAYTIKIKLRYVYLLPFCYLLLFVCCLINSNSFYLLPQYANPTSLISFMIEILFIFILIIRIYWGYKGLVSYESLLIKTILFALCISFLPIIALSILPSIFSSGRTSIVDPAYTGLFVMFFPASFAYLIGSKQLYDINLVLRRVMFASVISIIPRITLIIAVKIFDLKIPNSRIILLFLTFLIILTFVLYSLEYFSTKLEPIMFPKKHHLQKALKKISKNLTSVSSLFELKSIILVDLVGTLQVYGGAIVFNFGEEFEIISEGVINENEVEKIIKNQILEHTHYSIFCINQHEEYETFLIMSRKRNNTLLGLEESQWLNLIITYLAVSLENIHLIRKLTIKLQHLVSNLPTVEMAKEINWFRKLLFQLQEKERVRIATDLHDTTIQDLYFLKRRLMDIVDQYTFKQEDKQKINQILEYIEIMNTNLRNSCFELNPYLLKESGLVETVQKVIDHEKMLSDFTIDYFPMSPAEIESLSLDSKHHIFRIIQELINNAKKHSQARTIFLELDVNQNQFELQYEDDGIGFDASEVETKEIGGHGIGMEQMRTRVYSLNGSFELDTAPGKCVKISITFPLKEGRIA